MSQSDKPENSLAGLAALYGIRGLQLPQQTALGSGANGLAKALGLQMDPPTSLGGGANGLARALGIQVDPPAVGIAAALERSIRSRGEWNERFSHWERSESDSETQRIERARNMVQLALDQNLWLRGEGVRLVQQGSFTNRTNTRMESDIDLRVQHPDLKVTYAHGVDAGVASQVNGYIDTGRTYGAIRDRMRAEITSSLVGVFGRGAVDSDGSKAIRVNGLAGSRSEVDVVPCFTLHHVTSASYLGGTNRYLGAAIFGRDSTWTYNYPDQHIENGRAKRLRTGRQFKRVVRTVKRLQSDMVARGGFDRRVPSFLIECLVYAVEDEYFTVPDDDRYGRVQRVLNRISQRVGSALGAVWLYEINGIKPLFNAGQAWTQADAQNFLNAALRHLGNA